MQAQPIDQARKIIADCLMVPIDLVKPDTDLAMAGQIDSLTFELIVFEIERAAGKPVDPMKMMEARTVADIAAMLEPG